MKIAIISDIHDNAHNLVKALDIIQQQKCEKILFLGDFCGGGIANLLKSSPIPVFAIWGNNDGDKSLITKFALAKESNLTVSFDTYDIVEIDNRKIFITHYPMLSHYMAKSGDFDAIFYGHDHMLYEGGEGDCIIVNPGEIGAYKTMKSTFAIYETKDNSYEIIEIKDSVTANTQESRERFKEIKFKFNRQESHKRK